MHSLITYGMLKQIPLGTRKIRTSGNKHSFDTVNSLIDLTKRTTCIKLRVKKINTESQLFYAEDY